MESCCRATNAPIPVACGGFHISRDVSHIGTDREEKISLHLFCVGVCIYAGWANTLKRSVSVCKTQRDCMCLELGANYNELMGAANGSVNITWVRLWSFWNMCTVSFIVYGRVSALIGPLHMIITLWFCVMKTTSTTLHTTAADLHTYCTHKYCIGKEMNGKKTQEQKIDTFSPLLWLI